MKKIALLLGLFSWLHADVYYAKLLPIEELVIKSNSTGQVTQALEELEGTRLKTHAFITIDSELDRSELKKVNEKIDLQKRLLLLNKKVYQRHLDYYHSVQKISTKSKTEKDSAFYGQVSALEKYISMQNTLQDLLQRKEQLEKSIADKRLIYPGWYLYKLYVKRGDVVTKGTPLCKIANISKGKVTIFLTAEDAKNYKQMQLYIDNKPTQYHFENVWKISDEEHISSYQATLLLDTQGLFSKLVKIELKKRDQ